MDSIPFLDLVTLCFGCTSRHTNYIRKLQENHNALRTAMEELKELKNDMKTAVENAEGPRTKRLDQVQGWISRVEAMEAEIENLISDVGQEIENKCLGGCCPKNCKSSYKLGKKTANKIEQVNDLKVKGVFQNLVQELPSPWVDERPSELTVGLETTFDEVWRCITDEDVGIIGLYGLGGVGKTTLLTKVNNELCNTALCFDIVIWVVVTQNEDIIKIQKAIGNKIGLDDDEKKSQEDKAVDIFRLLSRKRFVLLLDDIWKRLDLSRVGIPLPKKKKNSKIVFTTRLEDVCGLMEADKKIEVKSLTWENAWDLFQKKVGDSILGAHTGIPDLAKLVAKKCGGLPIALITIGRAMACKRTPHEWRHAIAVLNKSSGQFSGMGDEVYPLLKFSYDSLPSDTIRSCFLYCSLFPEDIAIPKDQLIEYWFGEGFLDGFKEFNEIQNYGHDIIGILIRACLLEEEDGGDSVKMHDVIRDMAIWIGCECGKADHKLLVQARVDLKKAPEVEKWEGVETMSLMFNPIKELIEAPSCFNLSTLLLRGCVFSVISQVFFQSMPKLRVLDLSDNSNLDVLPAEISELVTLQYLNLSWTGIRELPIELKKLVGLKYLGLDGTYELDAIPPGIVSSYKKLQVLKMLGYGSPYVTAEEEENVMKDMESLKELSHLGFKIRSSTALSLFLNSPNLLRCTKELKIKNVQGLVKMYSILVNVSCIQRLEIHKCDDLSFQWPWDSEILRQRPCFHYLYEVKIFYSRRLMNLNLLVYAPNLRSLIICHCGRMEEIVSGDEIGRDEKYAMDKVFPELQSLYLIGLPQLKSIYPNALPFTCLKFIQVDCCPELKKLPLNFNSAKGCQLEIKGGDEWWNGLEWENDATQTAFLSSFTSCG